MSKKQRRTAQPPHESGRGVIKDNALKAIVTSELFKMRVEKPKKGKGSYKRQQQKGHMLKGIAPFDFLSPANLATQA
ncbi:ribosome alternative rescue factor ArfA [Shewanella marisflavi]|uniref:ribosome alternative rescue factor ArfA n=1 Tax=Shewanella marisflavi TaxID=260364 RepID=UPI00200E3E99|nr:ribosome alternative rescue factor ArfA [Shewanella marisflavi]MCL1041679.1 ribosome alternative rescue factor ArfA [Shewanella marisflavi]